MFCINCYQADTKVTNSRPHKKQPSIWRRRHCPRCGLTFTTLESPDISGILQLHDERHNVPVDYQKGRLLLSLAMALQAAGGQPDDAYWLVETVEQQALSYLRTHTASGNKLAISTLRDLSYEILTNYHAVAGLSYGASHGIVQTGSQKKRPGRPRSY